MREYYEEDYYSEDSAPNTSSYFDHSIGRTPQHSVYSNDGIGTDRDLRYPRNHRAQPHSKKPALVFNQSIDASSDRSSTMDERELHALNQGLAKQISDPRHVRGDFSAGFKGDY